MSENEQYRVFEQLVRRQRFAEAAAILLEYCSIGSAEQIEAVLKAANEASSRWLDFSKIKGPGSKSVENAIQRLRHPPKHQKEKHERRNHNLGLKPKTDKDGRHKRR